MSDTKYYIEGAVRKGMPADACKHFDSREELAEHLNDLAIGGRSTIDFIIGGSLGLAPEVMSRSDEALSFSKMTFPHPLMRVILLEQIYRSFRILNHEPYHK